VLHIKKWYLEIITNKLPLPSLPPQILSLWEHTIENPDSHLFRNLSMHLTG
jgi:hypothetical protein